MRREKRKTNDKNITKQRNKANKNQYNKQIKDDKNLNK